MIWLQIYGLLAALAIAIFAYGMPAEMAGEPAMPGGFTAIGWFNHERDILRYVFFHSLALACLVGLFVTLQAYVYPFTSMVIR